MYQKLTLHDVPRIQFAHAFSADRYDIYFPPIRNRLELTFLERGDVIEEREGHVSRYLSDESFHLICPDANLHLYSHDSPCSHLTVAFDADFTLSPISREELIHANRSEEHAAPLVAFCPEGSLPVEPDHPMKGTLHRLISLVSLPDAALNIRAAALLFDLLASMTEETVRKAMLEEGGLSPSGVLYARRAVRYIAANLTEKLTVDRIASHLGISGGYLSALFKAYTGESIVSYANSIRVERIKDLLISRSLKLKEAGESVGLSDENYMSRLFRQYTGQSVREFLRANRPSEHP